MPQPPRRLGAALLLLFIASGFAGLVYQSLWSHYLGLTLGHAAYAQTLVLSIFMGGMAFGAWLAGQRTVRWRRLLLAYAIAEGAIGLFGLAFHPLFLGYSALSQGAVLPLLGDGVLARLYPWVSGALLILPACVLLGATFPLLSAGYLRAAPADDGRVLGGLYFANGLGAAIGALGATFVLLPAFGMPGAMATAGVVNLLVAAGAWWVSRWVGEGTLPEAGHGERGAGDGGAAHLGTHTSPRAPGPGGALSRDEGEARSGGSLSRFLLLVAFASGAFSFVYEIGWIRMLNQVLGTTLHSFELMLAAFLLGLAFGGLWVRQRARKIADALLVAGVAQVWMGLMALVSVVLFAGTFDWVGWLMQALSRTPSGYALYSLGSAGIALLVMFPAAFFAGMTLPLFTMALLRAGGGESGIGRIYAANTLGAIAGVLLMVHVLIPLVGVRFGVTLAAVGDTALGFWLLARARTVLPSGRVLRWAAGCVAVLVLSVVLGRPDPRAQAAGVFRSGAPRLHHSAEVVYLRDGKTATVAVVRSGEGNSAAIITNGKSDAALVYDLAQAPRPDELTMVLTGALPLLVHPAPANVGVIGWGSGLSTHTILGSDRVERLETVEIEPAIHEGARLFGSRVARAYEDPRSHVIFDDARTFFAAGRRHYDVIVSEPSNPWVSGVASLFTREFYAFLRSHLAEDGVLVQWLQAYEIDDALVATMLSALLAEFPQAEMYLANDVDLVVVAYPQAVHAPDVARLEGEALRVELARTGLASAEEFALRRMGGTRVLRTFVDAYRAPPHSDFHPTVALRAPGTRFRGETSDTLQNLVDNGMPVLDILGERSPQPADAPILELPSHRFTRAHRGAVRLAAILRGEDAPAAAPGAGSLHAETLLGLSLLGPVRDVADWASAAAAVADATIGHLPAEDLRGVWIEPDWIDADVQPEAVRRLLDLYAAAAARDPAAMRAAADAALGLPDPLPLATQEHALVIAQLGALGEDDTAAVERLHRDYGVAIPSSERYRMVRHLLRVWAAQEARG
ncbi:spermine synthase [Coralloluteibacterium thermophilus]|uniref:Spermine synthase n=1 Tax=Coralloluteibacterium thermophilum TaxID=2707049 RepID=A0ABV9NLY0_9GAMM